MPKRKKGDFETLFKRTSKGVKIEKICWQITFAALMQPLQDDLRDPAAQDNSITHAAAAPSNLDAAITMRFAASRRKPAWIYAHGNTRWQQSCSHSTAICNHRFKTRKELRTPVAEHKGGTHSRLKRPQPHPPHTRGTFHRRLRPLYTEKTDGFVLRLPPQHKPHATFMQPLQCMLQHHVANPHLSTYMATPDDNNHAAIPLRSATTDSKHAKN